MNSQNQNLIAEQVRRASYSLDALCDLLQAGAAEKIPAVSVLTLLEPLRDSLHATCDRIDRDHADQAPEDGAAAS